MTARARVLVVEDKENMLRLLAKILAERHELKTATDGAQALAFVAAEAFDVVLTDIQMPGADGFEVLRAVKSRTPDTEVVMMTGYASVSKAVEAMKLGAYDYLQKPFDPDEVSLVVARAAAHKRQRKEARAAASASRGLPAGEPLPQRLVGQSPPMRELAGLIASAASLDITVLVQGESGTGKELIARGIHEASARRGHPFVPVNCGALPHELIESELFGHAKGAFTGAASAKQGLFEAAGGGTLFLDEIGDLPLSVQVKLNRVLQEKELRRVGENTPVKTDARVISATHRDLKAEAAAGRFREDLYYRLNVFPIRSPPLRERLEDLPLLAGHFLERFARLHHRQLDGFEPQALAQLCSYAWPGNVRELENVVERAVAVAASAQITTADLPADVRGAQGPRPAPAAIAQLPYRDAMELARDRVSREYLVALLTEFGGNVSRAAERAGIERESLHRLLKRFAVRSEEFKRGGEEA